MVHLFVQSAYTLLKITVRIEEIVTKTQEYGFNAVALTDFHVMHGIPSFLKICEREGIRGIIGMQVTVFYHEEKVPFLLLAKDNAGYANLMILSSMLNKEEEAVSLEDFKNYSRHCFIIAYGEGGWMDSELVNDNREMVYEKLSVMKKELPPFDIALSYQDASLWKMRNKILKKIAERLSVPVVALNKIYYLDEDDVRSYHVLNAIRLNKMVNDSSLPQLTGRYFLSAEEMEKLYEPEELQRTDEIAKQCNADGMVEKTGLPAFQGKYDVSSKEYLVRLCQAGLQKRLQGKVSRQYQSRLQYELDIILKMHFEDYFLIVYDFIRYARKQDILVGPGRGSAAGSLVAYCLGITQIDPLKYHLLFERFLNPDRVSMPDIDTDIPDNRRQEVIRYVVDTYGRDHVANIITFGTLGARQVIRDVARTMNMNQRDVDTVLKALGNASNTTLEEAYQNNSRFKKAVMSSRNNMILYEMAKKLEGLPRHSSIHAAGIVLSGKPLMDVIPTMQMDEEI
ncbi:MAG: DNA polymerase III subunit alpha, partial [Solobacterium sp.]|nr:DNA polymerase III subunit alpha [Solobacterium sp.]